MSEENWPDLDQLLAGTKTCSACNDTKPGTDFTVDGKNRGRPYLLASCKLCRAIKERKRRETDPVYRERNRQKSRQRDMERQAESLEHAANQGKEWTGPELEILVREDLTTVEISRMLGRTMRSVRAQRHVYFKEPSKQGLAGVVYPPKTLRDNA